MFPQYRRLSGGASLPPIPSREQLCSVRAPFQGLVASLNGYGEVPQFGVFCHGLDAANRAIWRAVERANGTHCLRAISVEYKNDGGFTYPTPGFDFTQDLPTLKARLAEDLLAGMYPVLYLAGDGQAYSPDGGTYGYTWLMQNMARIFACLNDPTINGYSFEKVGLSCLGFELISDGGWSPDNFETATVLQRQCAGPNAAIVSHIGTYTWWGDKAGSSGGPIADWSSEAGQAIDVCFEEGSIPVQDPDDGWQQRAKAHLGPASTNILPRNQVAYEWPQPLPEQTPRGQRYAVAEEINEVDWVRTTDGNRALVLAKLDQDRAQIASYGFTLIG